ncbi:MAG: c-type cytochrome, partial [Verrucomicrobia bacterium]|nr:c-type cytochrome [Verrucomicrobiota bacterium]
YPMGMDGKWKPGGRVKLLEDVNGDGKFDQRDKGTVFLDGIPFPTGVMAWRKGALVCAAPDIFYAEDTDGDGKADVVRKLFSGFYTDNYQARVNSLQLGLDGWIYGANGLLGGVIRGTMSGKEVNIRGQDFRMNPDSGEFEPASGLTQQGRVRDDWGNWFGCDNSTLLRHYPLPDHYLRRNPHVAAPDPSVFVPNDADPNQLFPASYTLTRFNDPHTANRTTSACGLGIYRDELLGREYYGNAFVCEPVHNLVHRLVLETNGVSFTAHRATDEQQSEFLASTDNWFRPVQVRTGPDGALWVVDMYRFLIEHPRWIPADRLAQIDPRAGDDKGRIYRVFPRGKNLKLVRDLTKLSPTQLAAALDSTNGTERDRVQLQLRERHDNTTPAELTKIFEISKHPAARLQALCVLDSVMKSIPLEVLEQALSDSDAAIRRHALRLSESILSTGIPNVEQLRSAVLARAIDQDPGARLQLALTLGEWNDPRAGAVLGKLVGHALYDKWLGAGVLASATNHWEKILTSLLVLPETTTGYNQIVGQTISTAVASEDDEAFARIVASMFRDNDTNRRVSSWQVVPLIGLLDLLERRRVTLPAYLSTHSELRVFEQRLKDLFLLARMGAKSDVEETQRATFIRLLGRGFDHEVDDLQLLIGFLQPSFSERLRKTALSALQHNNNPQTPSRLLADWRRHSPAVRGEILNVLLSRDEWTTSLLSELEHGIVLASEIPILDRQRLVNHANADLRRRSAVLFPITTIGTRAQVLEKYQPAISLAGNSGRGAEIFGGTCASCHVFRGQGFDVGPNLAALRDKDAAYWLKNILDPNAAIEPRFVNYQIETRDGRSLNGIASTETSTGLTLVQAGGVQEKILRTDIVSIRASGLSLMPEGLEQNLTPQDFADLITYLKTTPANFGSPPEELAAQARKQFVTEGANGFMHLFFSSEKLPYASWLGTLSMPHCRQTDGQSKLVWQTRPVPYDLRGGTFHRFRLSAAMGFASQPAGKFQLKLNNQPVLDFEVTLTDAKWQSADGTVRMSYTVMQNNQEDSNGILEIEISTARLQTGSPVTFEVVGSAANSQRWFGIYLL